MNVRIKFRTLLLLILIIVLFYLLSLYRKDSIWPASPSSASSPSSSAAGFFYSEDDGNKNETEVASFSDVIHDTTPSISTTDRPPPEQLYPTATIAKHNRSGSIRNPHFSIKSSTHSPNTFPQQSIIKKTSNNDKEIDKKEYFEFKTNENQSEIIMQNVQEEQQEENDEEENPDEDDGETNEDSNQSMSEVDTDVNNAGSVVLPIVDKNKFEMMYHVQDDEIKIPNQNKQFVNESFSTNADESNEKILDNQLPPSLDDQPFPILIDQSSPTVNEQTSPILSVQPSPMLPKSTNVNDHSSSAALDIATIDDKSTIVEEKLDSDLQCSYTTSITENKEQKDIPFKYCQLFSHKFDTCQDGSLYYNNSTYKTLKTCKRKSLPPVCSFTTVNHETHVNCNHQICLSKIKIGTLNKDNGKIKYNAMKNISEAEDFLLKITTLQYEFAFFYCQIKKKKELFQLFALTVRRHISDQPKEGYNNLQKREKPSKININVFVVDSVSRNHFYRILPKTIAKMKDINTNKTSSTSILDFQGFQSLAPFTYVNLQAFLSGNVSYESISNRRYNFEEMFHLFQTAGYQTMLQEDTCWYDQWGSLLTGNRKIKNPSKKKIWKEVLNITKYYGVDTLGLTHASCEVLKIHGLTNLYGSNDQVCLNGKPLSVYFMNYLKQQLQSSSDQTKPLFSYTHINFAHETSGMRLKTIDKDLSEFIDYLSSVDNTISILWSDHGGKTNDYSIESLTGRYEVYDPFLFMILPKTFGRIINNKQSIGDQAYQNLINHQRSLITSSDLRETLLDILRNVDDQSKDKKEFSNSLLNSKSAIYNRSDCSSLPIRSYALCKCINNNHFPDQTDEKYKDFLKWLAEFAMGSLNNKLNSQQNKNKTHCQRIIGKQIENIVLKPQKHGNFYSFDIVSHQVSSNERFNVQVYHNTKRDLSLPMLKLNFWQRVSFYSKFSTCKDEEVANELCICKEKKSEIITKKYLTNYQQFGVESSMKSVETCVHVIKRDSEVVVSYELSNLCPKPLNISFSTQALYSWESAKDLPIETVIKPNQIEYMTSFYKIYAGDETIEPIVNIL